MEKRKRRSQERRHSHAPLTGILFDALGNRMAATHACGRAERRYLYHVSRVPASDPDAVRVLRRVPAPQIESIPIERLRSWTGRPTAGWSELTTYVTRVGLYPETIVVDLVSSAHERWTAGMNEQSSHPKDGLLRITSPVRILTPGGRTSRIEGCAKPRRSRSDRALIAGLRRAHAELASRGIDLSHRSASIDHAHGVDDPYLRKLTQLAFVALDPQRAILEGRQPTGLELADLLSRKLPLDAKVDEGYSVLSEQALQCLCMMPASVLQCSYY